MHVRPLRVTTTGSCWGALAAAPPPRHSSFGMRCWPGGVLAEAMPVLAMFRHLQIWQKSHWVAVQHAVGVVAMVHCR